MGNVAFAVVDVETTGPLPERFDRIIEIAVLRTDAQGWVVDEYCSLVNPNRDVGSTRIHGITARDLKRAPSFSDIAGDVISRLNGAVFVAHNVFFDARFVTSELNRINASVPKLCTLCTMALSRKVDPQIPSRRLETICRHFGVPLNGAHTAYGDAKATAGVLAHCLQRLPNIDELADATESIAAQRWPNVKPSGKCYRRTDSAIDESQEQSFIGELIAKLPSSCDPVPGVNEYLDLLDRVLQDRRITEEEFEALLTHAEAVGLLREQVLQANRTYMQDLMAVALRDRRLSDAERVDLEQVRKLLCIPEDEFVTMLAEATKRSASQGPVAPARGTNLEGKSVCFTGELRCSLKGMPIERLFAQQVAESRGMVVKSGVSKALDYLVVADPESMSGKAKKAREYGIQIVAEPVFWQMMGVDVD